MSETLEEMEAALKKYHAKITSDFYTSAEIAEVPGSLSIRGYFGPLMTTSLKGNASDEDFREHVEKAVAEYRKVPLFRHVEDK
ncbi:hypothetical protein AB2B41_10785 [Marimonas sp. MJW-29]|uniref:Uncharacterized protein n=1 Tax=Sulfitobacter sediminis TaxID=3234186 RepID=A0ABV3RM97_9RHOB